MNVYIVLLLATNFIFKRLSLKHFMKAPKKINVNSIWLEIKQMAQLFCMRNANGVLVIRG